MNKGITKLTIRVYGLLIEEGKILLSREYIKGNCYTKFPGGGLEFGEGLKECLKREFMEEAGINIEVKSHFYTTENFLRSAFDENVQVISIYYLISSEDTASIQISENIDDLTVKEKEQVFYWRDLRKISEDDLDLPIDKLVTGLLLNQSNL